MKQLLAILLCAGLWACNDRNPAAPSVQDSAPGAARTAISLNRSLAGHYRAIAPACVGQQYRIGVGAGGETEVDRAGGLPIRPGDVVEFRNYLPEVPSDITALDAPAPMFSPTLVRPYNFVADAQEPYSFWRYEFPVPGLYEFFDTHMGDPGRKIVDSYYGTVSFVGESDAPRGVVCVDETACEATADCLAGRAPEGTNCCQCIGVCCSSDAQCASGKTCLRGRCVSVETGEP